MGSGDRRGRVGEPAPLKVAGGDRRCSALPFPEAALATNLGNWVEPFHSFTFDELPSPIFPTPPTLAAPQDPGKCRLGGTPLAVSSGPAPDDVVQALRHELDLIQRAAAIRILADRPRGCVCSTSSKDILCQATGSTSVSRCISTFLGITSDRSGAKTSLVRALSSSEDGTSRPDINVDFERDGARDPLCRRIFDRRRSHAALCWDRGSLSPPRRIPRRRRGVEPTPKTWSRYYTYKFGWWKEGVEQAHRGAEPQPSDRRPAPGASNLARQLVGAPRHLSRTRRLRFSPTIGSTTSCHRAGRHDRSAGDRMGQDDIDALGS